jgi:outer membrane protein assembly factor BamB
MKRAKAQVIREFDSFPGVEKVHGVTYDGQQVWMATGGQLIAIDPSTGRTKRAIDVAAHAGTAFDGHFLYQIAESRIQKIDPNTGRVLGSIPAPAQGGDSGLTWAEGSLWVGHYRERKIYQIDPDTGAILRTLESNRFVTGVTWLDGNLWHGTWEGDVCDLRRIDAKTGELLEQLDMPEGTVVSGLESDGKDRLFCGGGPSGKLRIVQLKE